MRILVIDDEPDVLLLCRVNLQYAGHEVVEACDAEHGLELAISTSPDLIVLDVMLPERDGLSLMRELIEAPATTNTPVVLLTAKAQLEDKLRGWRAGASEYVTKPFSPGDLSDLLVRIRTMTAEQRRQHRERAIRELAGTR